MQKFLIDNKLPYEVVWDLDVLGCESRRLNKVFSKKQQLIARSTGKVPQTGRVGRPGKFELDCRFCGDARGPPGELRQHFAQVHYKEERLEYSFTEATRITSAQFETVANSARRPVHFEDITRTRVFTDL